MVIWYSMFVIAIGAGDLAADANRVRAAVAGIFAADNARDLGKVLACCADDAVLLPPNEPAVRGKYAIKPRYEALFNAAQPIMTCEIDEVEVSDNWAFAIGTNRGRLVPKSGGEPRMVNDAFVMILKRQRDGQWLIARLIWHSAGPAR